MDAARLMELGAKLERQAIGEDRRRLEMAEALAWVEKFVDLALRWTPIESHEAFLQEVDALLGVGAFDAA